VKNLKKFNKLTFLILGLLLVSFASVAPVSAHSNSNWSNSDKNQNGNQLNLHFSNNNGHFNGVNQEEYNQQDREYMMMIIGHHKEAIAMADEELNRGKEQMVKDFAESLKQEQMEGMEKAKELYRDVFKEEPQDMMMSNLLNQLKSREDVDLAFLQLITMHHLDGIKMDKQELEIGVNREIKDFAKEDIQMQIKDLPKIYLLAKIVNK
jgi:uncharacterized protein (DUF305 family)